MTNLKTIPFTVENTWTPKGSSHGWGNGYVAIPPGHPLFGMDYNDLNDAINIHGGLTYGEIYDHEDFETLNRPDLEGHWIFGFDTCHYADNQENWDLFKVAVEAVDLKRQLDSLADNKSIMGLIKAQKELKKALLAVEETRDAMFMDIFKAKAKE
ncbi:MAG: hypothetical protein WC449_06305 [Candidatus Paceibacterota bacterium]